MSSNTGADAAPTPPVVAPTSATSARQLAEEASAALREVVLAAHDLRQRWAHELGITVSDSFALSHLAAGGSITAGELARRTGLAPSSVTALIDRLEKAGLAARTLHSKDRRSQAVALTSRGRAALDEAARWTYPAFAAESPEQLRMLIRQLTRMAGTLRGIRPSAGSSA